MAAKKAEQRKISKDQEKYSIEHNNIEDDSLLPAADELSKLNEVSPDIVPWIMARTEKEQDARIKFNEDRMALAKKDLKSTIVYNFIALIMAFFIVIAFLSGSFYLIVNGFETIGTIFAGGTIVIIVCYFLNASKRRSNKDK